MNDDLFLNGKKYISSKRASQSSGYTQDYLGQLIRGGKIDAQRIGRGWFVSEDSLKSYEKALLEDKASSKAEKALSAPVKRVEPVLQPDPVPAEKPKGEFTYLQDEGSLIPELKKQPPPIGYKKEIQKKPDTSKVVEVVKREAINASPYMNDGYAAQIGGKLVAALMSIALITGVSVASNDASAAVALRTLSAVSEKANEAFDGIYDSFARGIEKAGRTYGESLLRSGVQLEIGVDAFHTVGTAVGAAYEAGVREVGLFALDGATLVADFVSLPGETVARIARSLSQATDEIAFLWDELNDTTAKSQMAAIGAVSTERTYGIGERIALTIYDALNPFFGLPSRALASLFAPEEQSIAVAEADQDLARAALEKLESRSPATEPITLAEENAAEAISAAPSIPAAPVSEPEPAPAPGRQSPVVNNYTTVGVSSADLASVRSELLSAIDSARRDNSRTVANVRNVYDDINLSDLEGTNIVEGTFSDSSLSNTTFSGTTLGSGPLAWGGNVFTVDADNGRVGIGTTSPNDKLSINGAVYIGDSTPVATGDRLYNTGGDLYWNGSVISSASIGQWTQSAGNVYRVTGRVGIGTTSPAAELGVTGGLYLDSPGQGSVLFGITPNRIMDVIGQTANTVFNIRNQDNAFDSNGESANFRFATADNTFKGVAGYFYRLANGRFTGSPAGDGLEVSSAGDLYLYTSNPTNTLYASAGTTTLMGGNVGIGTTTPTQLLTVARPTSADTNVKVINTINQLDFGVDSTSAFIQARQAFSNTGTPLSFYVGNTEAVRIASSTGAVGIGTTTPQSALHVTAPSSLITITGTSAGSHGIQFTNQTGSYRNGIFYNQFNGSLVFDRQGTTQAVIDQFGNIGIGTSTPGGRLEVYNTSGVNSRLVTNNSGSLENLELVNAQNGATFEFRVAGSGSSLGNGTFAITNDGATTPYFAIASSGNVGIGTTSPFSKLSVAGAAYVGGNLTATGSVSVGGTLTATNLVATSSFTVNGSTQFNDTVTIANDTDFHLVLQPSALTNPVIWFKEFGGTSRTYFGVAGANGQIMADSAQGDTVLRALNGGRVLLSADSTNALSQFAILPSGNIGIGTTSPWAQLSVNPNGITGPSFAIGSSTRTDFVVTNGGNVGIGTNSPRSKLDVRDTLYLGTPGSTHGFINSADGIFFNIDSNADGSTENFIFGTDRTAGSGGSEFMRITAAGNVGIGTTTPSARLTVAGAVLADYFNATTTSATSTFAGGLAVGTTTRGANLVLQGRDGISTSDTASQITFYNNDAEQVGALNYIKTMPNHANGSQPKMVFGVPSNFSVGSADIEALTLYMGGNIDMYGTSGSRVRIHDQGTDTGRIDKLLITTGNDTAGSVAGIAFTANNGGNVKTAIYSRIRTGSDYGRSDLVFALNNVSGTSNVTTADEKARLTYEGNFGIGTTSPFARLSVAGDAYIGGGLTATSTITATSGSATIPAIGFGGTSFGIYRDVNGIHFKGDGNNTAVSISTFYKRLVIGQASGVAVDVTGTSPAVTVYESSNNADYAYIGLGSPKVSIMATSTGAWGIQDLHFNLDGTSDGSAATIADSRFVIKGATGNVGIGTTTPTNKLDIASGGNTALGLKPNQGANYISFYEGALTTTKAWELWAPNTGDLSFYSGGSDRVTFKSSGNVGIGTSSPLAELHVVTNTGGGSGITLERTSSVTGKYSMSVRSDGHFEVGETGISTRLLIQKTTGFVGIGTTSPSARLAVTGSGTGTSRAFVVANASSEEKFTVLDNGNVGIGTTSPYAKLAIVGEAVARNFTATSTSATSTFAGGFDVGSGALRYDFSSGVTSIDNLEIGNTFFEADAGVITWADLPVTSASAAGVVNSYTASINGNPLLSLYSTSDGSGGVTNLSVGVGTSSPAFTLNVASTSPYFALTDTNATANAKHWLLSSSDGLFRVGTSSDALSATSTYFTINQSGFVGIGTSSPQRLLHVYRSTDGPPVRFEDANGYCEIDPTTTTWACTSDMTLKKDIETLVASSSLSRIAELNAVSFRWNKQDETDPLSYGFVAQEVEQIFPELVKTDANGLKSVLYGGFTPFIVQAIQELKLSVEGLAARIETAEGRLTALEGLVGGMIGGGVTYNNTYLTSTTTASTTISTVSGWLSSLGAVFESGIARLGSIVAASLSAETVTVRNTANLAATGITIYDRATGNPYCMFVENGIQQTTAGECAAAAAIVPPPITSGDEDGETPPVDEETEPTETPSEEPAPTETETVPSGEGDESSQPEETIEAEQEESSPEPVPEPAHEPEPVSEPVSEPEPVPEPVATETP